MTTSTHRGVLLLAFAIGSAACDGQSPVRADAAATRRAQRAHRDGDLAVHGFNGPSHTGHDQRDRIPRRGNGDGRCQWR